MRRPAFDAAYPDLALVRRIFFQRLQREPNWDRLEDDNGKSFEQFVDFEPGRPDGHQVFGRCILDVFWDLVSERVLAPGKSLNASMQNTPFFHRTAYGHTVIAAGEYLPHDPISFLTRLDAHVPNVDATVRAYLAESLATFLHGNLTASMVMLGVAAERVFLLLCETLALALTDPRESAHFKKLLPQISIRPKLNWVHNKLRTIEAGKRPAGYPEQASFMATGIYELMRAQRNDLGHPREDPPRPTREDAYVHLQVFPSYYATAEDLRKFLKTNTV
jgi:hypothetical protein